MGKAIIHDLAKQSGVAIDARLIWKHHPLLKEITSKVVAQMQPHPMVNGKNLLAMAIRDGVRAFNQAAHDGSAIAPAAYYLAGLFFCLSQAASQESAFVPPKEDSRRGRGAAVAGQKRSESPNERSKQAQYCTDLVVHFLDHRASDVIRQCRLPSSPYLKVAQ